MAKPAKALADYVYVREMEWTGLEPAVESLRIERDEFQSVTSEDLTILMANYANRRVQKFIRGLRRALEL